MIFTSIMKNKYNVLRTPSPMAKRATARRFRKQRLTSSAYMSTMATVRLHTHCKMVVAMR